jgi:signal transduction histidine kinase
MLPGEIQGMEPHGCQGKPMATKATKHKEPARPRQGTADEREEILNIAGHELRAPLAVLKGQIQLMQRRVRNEPDREADVTDLKKMMYQVERLNHQLDIILGTVYIARKRLQPLPAPFDLIASARHIVEIFAAGATGHVIRLEADAEQLYGSWDRRLIEQSLTALLTNALKFGKSSDVTVHISRRVDSARVEVEDQGSGVLPDERRRIFAPYVTGSNVKNGGVGLGLHVARETIKRHGGKIGVVARQGGGSIFWFELPLALPPALAAHARTDERTDTDAAPPTHQAWRATSQHAALGVPHNRAARDLP